MPECRFPSAKADRLNVIDLGKIECAVRTEEYARFAAAHTNISLRRPRAVLAY
jgi:hypothetical protein